jgi:hypothetical protein
METIVYGGAQIDIDQISDHITKAVEQLNRNITTIWRGNAAH